VLVHGTSGDHNGWAPVFPALEQHFTVYAVDRRGRGGSGDALEYSIELEFDDVAAVVDAIGGPVNLLGHSYGGVCALGAAMRTTNLHRLILYEPPAFQPGDFSASEMVRRMQSLLGAGDRDGVVTLLLQEIVLVPPDEIDLLRSMPAWAGQVAAAHTIPREFSSFDDYVLDLTKLSILTVPTLFLTGGDSPAFINTATATLRAALPNSREVIMPGQQHLAMNTAPEFFVREVIAFITNPK